ncbi:MAG TPA: hypothetical protein VJZ27_18635, partial [Aggregatilineales bacterium]|nr:hypothetical protein [Aggregatilineales bacterium]
GNSYQLQVFERNAAGERDLLVRTVILYQPVTVTVQNAEYLSYPQDYELEFALENGDDVEGYRIWIEQNGLRYSYIYEYDVDDTFLIDTENLDDGAYAIVVETVSTGNIPKARGSTPIFYNVPSRVERVINALELNIQYLLIAIGTVIVGSVLVGNRVTSNRRRHIIHEIQETHELDELAGVVGWRMSRQIRPWQMRLQDCSPRNIDCLDSIEAALEWVGKKLKGREQQQTIQAQTLLRFQQILTTSKTQILDSIEHVIASDHLIDFSDRMEAYTGTIAALCKRVREALPEKITRGKLHVFSELLRDAEHLHSNESSPSAVQHNRILDQLQFLIYHHFAEFVPRYWAFEDAAAELP